MDTPDSAYLASIASSVVVEEGLEIVRKTVPLPVYSEPSVSTSNVYAYECCRLDDCNVVFWYTFKEESAAFSPSFMMSMIDTDLVSRRNPSLVEAIHFQLLHHVFNVQIWSCFEKVKKYPIS